MCDACNEAFYIDTWGNGTPMTTALVPATLHLGTLWTANLLCVICEEHRWTTTGRWHPRALLCADCRIDEPNPFDEDN